MSIKRGEEARLVADIIRMLQKQLQCVICFETLRDPMTTRCGHTFCQVCINRVVKGKNALCPLCNTRMNRRGIVENDKVRGVVKAVHILISNAQKDITDMGYEDVLQLLRENTHCADEQPLSPIQPKIDLPSTSADQKTVSRRSKKVESWLLDVHAPSPSQVSSVQFVQPVVENNIADEESGSEMESVSQINSHHTSERKPLSAYIEDDRGSQGSVRKSVLQKSKKLLTSKKMGQLNVKSKQESLKGFGALRVTPTKAGSKLLKGNVDIKVPDPVIVVMDLDKENTSNQLPTNPSSWSRVQRMKEDFHVSPAHSIEDPGSSDDTPCLNLSLDSPVLKKKNRVIEIVNSLQSEIEICERSTFPIEKSSERNLSFHSSSRNAKKRLAEPSSVFAQQAVTTLPSSLGFSYHQPIVKFLKLGRLVKKKSPSVPIYLKGSLENLSCEDPHGRMPHRQLLDAETQTDPDILGGLQDINKISVNDQGENSLNASRSSVKKRSLGAQSEVDMDAETVIFTQPINSMNSNRRAISPLSFTIETSNILDSEIIGCTNTQKSDSVIMSEDAASHLEKTCGTLQEDRKQTQYSDLIGSSLDVVGTPKKTVELETTSICTPLVDIDDDSSSSVVDRSSKRARTLGSSSDSSDSDIGLSRKQKQKRKKNKIVVLSDNENSSGFPNGNDDDDDPDMSAVDTSKIMANIEAQLAEEERMQSSKWPYQVVEENTEPMSEVFEECSDVLSNTSKNQIDSDGDSEVINPTPQKQTSFTLRQTTQSDDIVPSSQPPVPTRKSPPKTESNHKDSTVNKSYDPQQNDVLTLQDELKNTCEDIQEDKNHSSSEVPVTGDTTVPILSSIADEVAEDTNKMTKIQFVCSSLPGTLVAQVEKLAKIVGAEFSSKFMTDTSHLIVRVDGGNKADKTLKYLCAVAAGKWVVSFAWVEKCLEAGRLLPEGPFEALDASGEPGPRRSREARLSKKNLFKGFEFCCIGDFPDISKAQMQALLIDCGATMVSEPTDFSFQDHIIPVALAQWDESKEAEYNSWIAKYSSVLVQHEWVLDCIGKFSVTSFSAMLLCDDISDDYLASMGIPSYLIELTESEQ